MTRYLICGALLLGLLATLGRAAAGRPNIVWIIADDMSPDTGAYGYPGVKTPHLDRLATEGRRYDHAYVSAPVCSSSRSAFILGTYQTTTGLHAHDVENPQPLAAPYRPLPALLRAAGWFVTNAPAPGSVRSGRAITRAKTHYNFAHDPAQMYDGTDWRRRAPGQPFFAQFQVAEPHRPFPIPASFDEAALRDLRLPPNYPDHPLVRRDWYAYLRSVEEVDRKVGQILAELAAEGVLDHTVVMFFGDNGRPMPWGKQWLSVEGLRVPLLVRGPAVPRPGVESRPVSLIDLAPTVLTLAGLPVPAWMEGRPVLGAPFPERRVIFAARDRCGDAPDRIRAVISETHLLVKNYEPQLPFLNWSGYKETSYPGMPLWRVLGRRGALSPRQAMYLEPGRNAIELYDLRADPRLGVTNVAAEPGHAATREELQRELETWVQTSGDCGARPDPATEPTLAEIQKSKRLDYQRAWQARGLPAEPSDEERLAWWERSYHLAPAGSEAPAKGKAKRAR